MSDFPGYAGKLSCCKALSSGLENVYRESDLVTMVYYLLQDDLLKEFPDCGTIYDPLGHILMRIVNATGRQFVMIIDDWDLIIRNYGENTQLQKEWLAFLGMLFKSSFAKDVFAAAYLTGILPISKVYSDRSIADFADSFLADFREYTIDRPKETATFFGLNLRQTAI